MPKPKTGTSLPLDKPISTRTKHTYLIKSDHRGKTTEDKCTWTISRADEITCFEEAIENNWIDTANDAWGLRFIQEKPDVLGQNHLKHGLKIAKFVAGTAKNQPWHGYPADYRQRPQDRPATSILQNWRSAGIIEKHEIGRISRGHRCSLSD